MVEDKKPKNKYQLYW